jgi:hypothetical protein
MKTCFFDGQSIFDGQPQVKPQSILMIVKPNSVKPQLLMDHHFFHGNISTLVLDFPPLKS